VGAPENVQGWLRRGAPIQWRSRKRPPPFNFGESCSRTSLTSLQQQFLDKETQRCLNEVGSWEPATCAEFVSPAFLVPKPGQPNKWRLVVDLRFLNKYCKKFKMRSETLAMLSNLSRKNDFMFSFDLKDGYNAVGVAPEDRKYMTFNLQGRLFSCSAVPFGWNQSAYVFCETIKVWIAWMRAPPLVETVEGAAAAADARLRWQDLQPGARRLRARTLRPGKGVRARGVRLLWYVDDILVLCSSEAEALETRAYVEATLARLGLQRQESKGMWEPGHVVTHLGLQIDTKQGVFQLTDSRQAKLARISRSLGAKAARERR
jgi:hypothetical protein